MTAQNIIQIRDLLREEIEYFSSLRRMSLLKVVDRFFAFGMAFIALCVSGLLVYWSIIDTDPALKFPTDSPSFIVGGPQVRVGETFTVVRKTCTIKPDTPVTIKRRLVDGVVYNFPSIRTQVTGQKDLCYQRSWTSMVPNVRPGKYTYEVTVVARNNPINDAVEVVAQPLELEILDR